MQGEHSGEIERDVRLEDPARRGTGESAGSDCVGEHPLQWGALLDLVFATAIFDAVGEVKVQLLTELVHSAQDPFGPSGVLGYRATD